MEVRRACAAITPAWSRQAHAAGKKVFLPAHPGHDNSGFRPNDFFVMPRDDGATLRGYLRAATDAGADAVLVTSFNEWPETTVVEPSSSWPDPYFYLKNLGGVERHRVHPAAAAKNGEVKNPGNQHNVPSSRKNIVSWTVSPYRWST